MKTLNSKKTVIGTSTVALAIALGITQASAFSLGEFFGFSSSGKANSSVTTGAEGNTSARADTNSNTSITTRGTSSDSLNASATGTARANTNANLGAGATGNGSSSSMGQSVSGYANSRATTSLPAASSTDWNAHANAEASIIARVVAWFKAVFNIGQDNEGGINSNATSAASTTLDGTASTSLDVSPNINAFMNANVNATLNEDTE